MSPLGILFDGSDSLFRTQHSLVKVTEHAVWLSHFTPTKLEHLHFVLHLHQTFCKLDICCAITGNYPAYIVGVITSYYCTKLVIRRLHIARTASTILDNIYRKAVTFVIGTFQFHLTKREEYEAFPDVSKYDITFETVTVCFSIATVNASTSCRVSVFFEFKSSINLTNFIWEYMCGFAFKLYAILCVPLNTPTVLNINHHRAASNGLKSNSLCDMCSEKYRLLLQPFVGKSTTDRSFRCNVCLRKQTSLNNLNSHTVFQLTFNLS